MSDTRRSTKIIRVSPEIHTRAKAEAARRLLTLSQFTESALNLVLPTETVGTVDAVSGYMTSGSLFAGRKTP